jgi:hypothetical protein
MKYIEIALRKCIVQRIPARSDSVRAKGPHDQRLFGRAREVP